MNSERVRIIARKTLDEQGITSFPINLEQLISKIKSNVCDIKPYSQASETIAAHNLYEYSQKLKAFTYSYKGKKIILFEDNLSYLEKVHVICHELAHIKNNHLSYNGIIGKSLNEDNQNILEQEAEEFALEFQAPVSFLVSNQINNADALVRLGIYENKNAIKQMLYYEDYIKNLSCKKAPKTNIYKYFISSFLIITIMFTGIFIFNLSSDNNSLSKTDNPVINSDIINENVFYITPSGHKYHHSWCSTIKNSVLIDVTVEEAEKAGYEPCKTCHLDK